MEQNAIETKNKKTSSNDKIKNDAKENASINWFKPSYFNDAIKKRFVHIIKGDSPELLAQFFERYVNIKWLYFYTKDLPRLLDIDTAPRRSIFSENTELCLTPTGLVTYMRKMKMLKTLTDKTFCEKYNYDPFALCYAKHLPHKKSDKVYSMHPLTIAMRSEFFDAIRFLTTPSNCDFYDILSYGLAQMRERPGLNIMQIVRILWQMKTKMHKILSSGDTEEMVSAFRMLAQFAYYRDTELSHTHQIIPALNFLFERTKFASSLSSGTYFMKNIDQVVSLKDRLVDGVNGSTKLNIRLQWDAENCIALLLALYDRSRSLRDCIDSTGNRISSKLSCLILNILRETQWLELFYNTPSMSFIKHFCNLSESVRISKTGMQKLATNLPFIEHSVGERTLNEICRGQKKNKGSIRKKQVSNNNKSHLVYKANTSCDRSTSPFTGEKGITEDSKFFTRTLPFTVPTQEDRKIVKTLPHNKVLLFNRNNSATLKNGSKFATFFRRRTTKNGND